MADRDWQLTITGRRLPNPEELFAGAFDDLLAPIKTRWADVVTQMDLARRRLDGQGHAAQGIVRTMHATLGRGFLVLLHSHHELLESNLLGLVLQAGQY